MTGVFPLANGKYASFDAELPGPADPAAFKKYSLNIIVGPLGPTGFFTNPHGVEIRKPATGAVFYNSNAGRITELTLGELKKIIAP